MAMRVLHLDVDAFFAAVEQRDDPRLCNKPVAVGTGVVASCSYEAKRGGVYTGMRLLDARRVCRSLIVLPGDYRKYEIAGRQVLGICHDRTPKVEVAALDDLYLEVRAAEAEQVAHAVAAQVRAEVGLHVSIGVGASKLVAAVATQEVKNRKVRGEAVEVVVVPEGTERTYLAPWPVEILPGVGSKARHQLERMNVRRVEQLAEVPVAVLVGLFGQRGRVLRDLALGIDAREVKPFKPPLSISRCTSFDPPTGEMAFLGAMLDHLLERAALWLRMRDLAAKGMTLNLRYGDYRCVDGRVSLPSPSSDEAVFKPAARQRLDRLYTRRLPLRLLGVELSPLQPAVRQQDLFVEPDDERRERLRACKDDIRQRFGFMAVLPGSALELVGRIEHDRDNFRLRTPCLTR